MVMNICDHAFLIIILKAYFICPIAFDGVYCLVAYLSGIMYDFTYDVGI